MLVSTVSNATIYVDNNLCVQHKADFEYFKQQLNTEREKVCSSGCTYTPTMAKNSDTMERVAGLYYLQNCDTQYGRLKD